MRQKYDDMGDEKIITYQKERLNNLISSRSEKFILSYDSDLDLDYRNALQEIRTTNTNVYIHSNLPEIHSAENMMKYTFEAYEDNHPTSEGHRIIAESMYAYLEKNNVVQCN